MTYLRCFSESNSGPSPRRNPSPRFSRPRQRTSRPRQERPVVRDVRKTSKRFPEPRPAPLKDISDVQDMSQEEEIAKWTTPKAMQPLMADINPYQRSFTPEPFDLGQAAETDSNAEMSPDSASTMSESSFSCDKSTIEEDIKSLTSSESQVYSMWETPDLGLNPDGLNPEVEAFRPSWHQRSLSPAPPKEPAPRRARRGRRPKRNIVPRLAPVKVAGSMMRNESDPIVDFPFFSYDGNATKVVKAYEEMERALKYTKAARAENALY